MEHLNELLPAQLEKEIAGITIEKIIHDIIFNHVKDMIFIMKVEEAHTYRYLFANEAGLVHAGITKEAIGKTIDDVLPFERAKTIRKEYDRVLKSKMTESYSDELRLPNGKVAFWQSILTPVKDEQGAIRFIVAITRDITHAVNEKNRLLKAEQKYRSLADHNLDGVFTLSINGKIIEVNPAGQMLVGYPARHLKERGFLEFIPQGDCQKYHELFHDTINGFALESMDCRLIHAKGHYLKIQLKTVPIVINSEITGMYIIARDISKQTEDLETIKFMAFHDQLTGLYNRRALLNDLENCIIKNKNSSSFALLSIDLDRFKSLNDSLGHLAGDQILRQVAERLSEFSKSHTRIYRQGGDEFAILFEGNMKEATTLAQKILSTFAKSFYQDQQEYFITPSIGISMFPNDGKDAETIIKNADEALFRVKERGKAHFQFYRSEMTSVSANIVSLETHLRKALTRDEFVLHYQPQVNLITGEVNSFEALIRWKSPELGMVSPADFIPLAEDTGLIIPIGNWVIETACRQLREWRKMGINNKKIAINISPKQFLQLQLVDTIKRLLTHYEIEPSLLELEITEGAMRDMAETSPILKNLKELGVMISIDDFGTGYSSLNYIKQFPIDVLKIDQSFVRDVNHNEKDAAITTTIIHLANSLGVEVVAEGIEEEDQAEFLLQANCQKGQGYLYSRPVSAEEIERNFFVKYG